MNQTKSSHIYIGLDCSYLRDFIYFDILVKNFELSGNTGRMKKEDIKDPFIRNNLNYMYEIYGMVKADQIRFLICSTVYHEVAHSKNAVEFIKENCYMDNVDETNAARKAQEVESLVNDYCSPIVTNGTTYAPPMTSKYNAYAKKVVPSNEAYIMAEYTVAGASMVLTCDKDFTDNKKIKNGQNIRKYGIMDVNINHGYYFSKETYKGQKQITTAPMSLDTLALILHGGQNRSIIFIEPEDETKLRMDDIDKNDKVFYDSFDL